MTDTPIETKPAAKVAPGDARILCWLAPHEGAFVVTARVSIRGRRTLDVKLGDEGTLFFLAALRAAHPDALPETGVPDMPSIEGLRAQVSELEEENAVLKEDLRSVSNRAAARISELDRELEGYRRDAARAAPTLGAPPEQQPLELPPFAPVALGAVTPKATPAEPDAPKSKRAELAPELLAELEETAKRIDNGQMVALSDLRHYVEHMKFQKLEGVHVDAFARASDLVSTATDDPRFDSNAGR